MPQRVKGYFYHISQELSPKDHILGPRRDGQNRACEEPDIPRICVCPTIAGCISAVGPCLRRNIKIRVFKTKNKVNAVVPYGPPAAPEYGKAAVIDSYITKEKWLIRKTSFKFIGYIDLMKFDDLLRFRPGSQKSIKRQQKAMEALLKIEKENELLSK